MMKNTSPNQSDRERIVDVLIPVRMPAPWLGEAIEGVRNQIGVKPRVVLVIHGEEGDLYSAIKDIGVEVVRAPDHLILAEVLNLGLDKCSSEYVARLDQDDIPTPERLLIQSEYLDANPNVIVVGSSATLIDETGRVVGSRTVKSTPEEILKTLRWKSPIMHPTVMFRREPILEIGGYSREALFVEDYELWLRAAAIGSIGGIPKPLLSYRVHSNQVSQSRKSNRRGLASVRDARIALALNRNESKFVARLRNFAWASRQWIRIVQRRI